MFTHLGKDIHCLPHFLYDQNEQQPKKLTEVDLLN